MFNGGMRKSKKNNWSDYNLNPRGKKWLEDDNSRGQKLLKQMGWKSGEGLGKNKTGIKEPIQLRKSRNCAGAGLGFNPLDPNKNWLSSQLDFDSVLLGLQDQHVPLKDKLEMTSSAAEDSQALPMEQKSKRSRHRVHYHRMIRSKDMSHCSQSDWDSILGRKRSPSGHLSPKENGPDEASAMNSETYFLEKRMKWGTSTRAEISDASSGNVSESEKISCKGDFSESQELKSPEEHQSEKKKRKKKKKRRRLQESGGSNSPEGEHSVSSNSGSLNVPVTLCDSQFMLISQIVLSNVALNNSSKPLCGSHMNDIPKNEKKMNVENYQNNSSVIRTKTRERKHRRLQEDGDSNSREGEHGICKNKNISEVPVTFCDLQSMSDRGIVISNVVSNHSKPRPGSDMNDIPKNANKICVEKARNNSSAIRTKTSERKPRRLQEGRYSNSPESEHGVCNNSNSSKVAVTFCDSQSMSDDGGIVLANVVSNPSESLLLRDKNGVPKNVKQTSRKKVWNNSSVISTKTREQGRNFPAGFEDDTMFSSLILKTFLEGVKHDQTFQTCNLLSIKGYGES